MPEHSQRRLTIDDGRFLLDGDPHQIISGSLPYFRILPDQWHDRLAKLRAMGCNALETYVPWNVHEPKKGQFDFTGHLDLERYLDMAADEELNVLIRPGPYICAEWEFGGLPWWLLQEHDIDLRCSHPSFLEHVDRWWGELIPRIKPYLSTCGGPIVACQIENEYGYYGDDAKYLDHLKRTLECLGVDVLLFTSDGTDSPHHQANGSLQNVLGTANFGSKPEMRFAGLRAAQPKGPQMCMEFWIGWFDTWGESPKSERSADSVVEDLSWMLKNGASVNFFVFCGGTSFGFMSGANLTDHFAPQVTSYDYDALLTECGDVTPKYLACREAIAAHTGRKDLTLSFPPSQKISLGDMRMTECSPLVEAAPSLADPVQTTRPVPIETLGQGYGYVLYRSRLPGTWRGGQLRLRGVRDFAHVLINEQSLGTFYRNDDHPDWMIEFDGESAQLDILVDCMARPNFGHRLKEGKGITDGVYIGGTQQEERAHFGWECYALPMTDLSGLTWSTATPIGAPAFYRLSFNVEAPADTFLELPGFTKGFAMVNGFNLGRFWNVGPQFTLYIPWPVLKSGQNELIVFEAVESADPLVRFIETPVWRRSTL